MKKVLYWIIGIFLFLLLTGVTITAIYEDEIGEKVIEQVNQRLKTELVVEDVDLSLFRSFPDASAELIGVVLKDTKGGALLEAKKVGFRLGLFSLFKENKDLKKVVIEDGALQILIDRKGRSNFDIFKPGEQGETSSSEVNIQLAEAQLKDMELIYSNEETKQELFFDMEDAVFSGAFSNDQFELESMAKLHSRFVELGTTRYLVDKEIGYLANVFIHLSEGLYDFKRMEVAIDRNVFKVDGFIDDGKEGTNYDLAIRCDDGNIESVIQLLPEQYIEVLSDFRGKGKFLFDAKIDGLLNSKSSPVIEAKMELEKGRITSPRLSSDLKDVSFSAILSNGKYKNANSSYVQIPRFKGYFNRELLEMKLKVQNLDRPNVDIFFDGSLPIESIYKLFGNEQLKSGDGEIEIHNLKVKGLFSDMVNPKTIHRVDASGSLEFDDASFIFEKEEILFDRGGLVINDNKLKIKDLKIEGAGSEMELKGQFVNVLPVLFADSVNSKNASLKFDASLSATEIDFDRLVGLTTVSEEAKKEAGTAKKVDSLQVAQNEKREFIANFLKGTFKANIDQFNYDRIKGEDFIGAFTFDNKELKIKGEAKGMEGYFDLDGHLFFENEPYLNAKIECNEINIHDFFLQTHNFGQSFITDENLKGTLTARILIDAFWDEKGSFQDDKLVVLSGISILDGELKNLELLETFSKYIHLEDLKHIVFSDLENWLEIRNRKVNIPVMFVRSNALNMTVSGSQTFDQAIDYNLKINAGQVLVNFLKPHNPNLQPQRSEKNGWFNLYYNILGTLDNNKITTNRRRVQSSFTRSDRQKRKVQAELVKAFGPIEFDTGTNEPRNVNTSPTSLPPGSTESDNTTITEEEEDEYIDWED